MITTPHKVRKACSVDFAILQGLWMGGRTKTKVLGLLSGPQKDGVANPEATNGKPPRDLGFQDTGKQRASGMEGRRGRRRPVIQILSPLGTQHYELGPSS